MRFVSSIFLFAANALLLAAAAPRAGAGEEASTAPPGGILAEPFQPKPEDAPPGFFEDKGAARGRFIAEHRGIEVDSAAIRRDQKRMLLKLNSHARDALNAGFNRFTTALDRGHDNFYLWMDNTVRMFDLRLGAPGSTYEHELSSFVLTLAGRGGGRGNDGDYDAKVRFRADVSLPGLEDRFHLVMDNWGRDELPGTDPMLREDDFRLGVHSSWKSFFGHNWDLGGGLRCHRFVPVGYVDLTWDWSARWGNSTFKFDPRVVWYSDSGFGHDASFSWTSDRSRHTIWQFVTAENIREHESGVHLEETMRIGFPHHAKGCGWIFRASLFPHVAEHGHSFIDDIVLGVTWRDALYRRWMFYSITPQADFAAEDGHDPEASIRIGITVLFGRETGGLL